MEMLTLVALASMACPNKVADRRACARYEEKCTTAINYLHDMHPHVQCHGHW
jgi:hypothetical protein